MKKVKRILSVILSVVLFLSAMPVLNLDLFKTDAGAVAYTKAHAKEYYYNPDTTKFIAYLANGSDEDGNTAKKKVTDSGYTLIDKNLNAGVRVSDGIFSKRDADEVYLGYKTSTDPSVSIRDIRIMINKGSDYYTSPENGFAYTLVGLSPISQNDNDGGGSVDLNQSKSSADYLHYFATKDVGAGAPIVGITVNNEENQSGYDTVKYLNSGNFNSNADANRDAGGEYIFTHIARLPEVDTTALRSAMEQADTYIAGENLYVDISAVKTARDSAKAITDSFDNYAAVTEAFSTLYDQVKIDNAKTAIENAIAALQTKLDWTEFNSTVSKANALNKNDYVDFSPVENALNNADLVKNSFTKQEQVDNETAKINSAINSLVKKTTAKSFVQGNAEGHDDGWTFQSCVTLEIYNVNSGTDCDYWNTGAGVDNNVDEEYEKTAQYTSDKWNASKATIYVDPDVNSDIRSTGVYVTLKMPHFHSELGRGRWGVELAEYQDNYTMGKLRNDWRTVTVQSTNGKSLTYSLCDENGNDKASAQTSNGDFTLDETIISGEKGPYTWYIKGAVPAAGDKATVRVLGICAAWAHSGNVQKLTEFTDLTIVSVSKTALKKAIYTVIGNESIYTASTYSAYKTALSEANAVLNNATAEQTEVDAATAKLNNAIDALQSPFDMSSLYIARDRANALNGSDYEDFSEVANLVNMIPNTTFNSQQEVDEYADKLNYAIAKLIRKGFSTSGTVVSQHESEHHDDANVQGRLTAKGANFVSESIYTFFSGYNSESSTETFYASFSNGSGDDLHRAFQSDTDGKAIAYYVFDRYSNKSTDVSSLGNILSLYMYGIAKSHQHSITLYDSSYNQNSILIYDTTHTSTTAVGSKSGKSYSYTLKNGGVYCDWEETTFKTTQRDDLSLEGAVPDVGDTVTLRAVYRNGVRGLKKVTGYLCYGWMTFNFVTVDSTALRNAIAMSKNVLDKSKYSEASYNAYLTALSAASDTLNGSSVPSQSDYETKATALVNAINNLERVQTVTLDSQPATTAGTASVVAAIGKAMPSIELPSREHYNFDGYYTQPNGLGTKYYNADGSSARNFDLESDVTLYANWIIDKFEIEFVNYDGSLLSKGLFEYGSTPTYSGTPTRDADESYDYTFSGWSPAITTVTGDTTYTAQFSSNAHSFKYVSINTKQHQLVCENCKYESTVSNHSIVKDETTGYYKCTECSYYVAQHSVKVNGVELPLTLRDDLTTQYLVATLNYANANRPNENDEYFVYWKDSDTGEIISSYTTYSFFVTKDYNIEPVFASQKDYYTERAKATSVTRMVDIKDNENGTYTLMAEHSVSSTVGKINKHGIIYTYDPELTNLLDYEHRDNDGILTATAEATASTPTGLYTVNISKGEHSAVYAVPFICFVDSDGNKTYEYGKMLYREFDGTASGESEIISTSSYDLGDISAEEPIEPVAPTVPTDSVEDNAFGQLTTFFARLIEIIKTVLSFFGITGVAK